ncbi:MAG TPA: hypothetical protein VIL35_10155 [Vicinamibacterales bacterium]
MSAADVLLLIAALAAPQAVPQPFPGARTAGGSAQQQPPPAATAPAPQAPAAPATAATGAQAPGEAELGVPVYPGAQFIASYDAGQGQRYYLFGSTATFDQLVSYYRAVLKTRGNLVFDTPATHMFDIGRFREESMAFPPSVTIKDYLWGGRGGYLNPVPGAEPQRFPTIIQIVPAPR